MIWLLLTGQALISSAGLLTLRNFMPLFLEKGLHSQFSLWLGVILGIFLYGTSFLTWLFILSKYQVSFAYPYTIGVTLALTVLGALLFFKESITPLQIIGLVLLVISIFFISSNPASR